MEEDNDIEGLKEQKKKITLEYTEKKFITSPTDIDVHSKVDLQDAEVTKSNKMLSKNYVMNIKTFLTNSSDIGKTPLIEMEIDTSGSTPITPRPYTLPLKHATWVQKELKILEKAGVIVRSVSPWACPIVEVPKGTTLGEASKKRLCVYY